MFDRRVWLEVPLRRVDCLTCGVTTEHVRWLPERSRLTTRLIAHVEALLRLLPTRHIEQLIGLHWHTIRAIDARRLAREVQPPDLSRVRRLIMDEFALFKGHRYATVRSVPIPSRCCGWAKAVPARTCGRFSRCSARKFVHGSRR